MENFEILKMPITVPFENTVVTNSNVARAQVTIMCPCSILRALSSNDLPVLLSQVVRITLLGFVGRESSIQIYPDFSEQGHLPLFGCLKTP